MYHILYFVSFCTYPAQVKSCVPCFLFPTTISKDNGHYGRARSDSFKSVSQYGREVGVLRHGCRFCWASRCIYMITLIISSCEICIHELLGINPRNLKTVPWSPPQAIMGEKSRSDSFKSVSHYGREVGVLRGHHHGCRFCWASRCIYMITLIISSCKICIHELLGINPRDLKTVPWSPPQTQSV